MAATTYTLTGPSSGEVAREATFTVTPDGVFTGTITLHDGLSGRAAGTFSPPSLSWSGTSEAKTFSYTPPLIGPRTIGSTNTGGLTDPAGVVFTGRMQLGITRPLRRSEGYDPADHTTPDLGGYVPCRAGPLSEYTRPIDADPVHPHNDLMMGAFEAGGSLSTWTLNFNGQARTEAGGMPLSVVGGDQAKVPVTFPVPTPNDPAATNGRFPDGTPVPGAYENYPQYCDPGPYPIPDQAGIQSWLQVEPQASWLVHDAHCLVFDRDNELLYEGYHCFKDPEAGWVFASGAVWDMAHGGGGYRHPGHEKHCDEGIHRHITFPVNTAAGLPIFPLSARYDEILRGEIAHAIGLTMLNLKLAGTFVWPARGVAYCNRWNIREVTDGTNSYGWAIPYGARLRLKASWYEANVMAAPPGTWGPQSLVFLECFRKYGVVPIDGSSLFEPWMITDHRWDHAGDLAALNAVPMAAFEVVQWEDDVTLSVEPASAQPGTPRTITFGYNFRDGENPGPLAVAPQPYAADGTFRVFAPWEVTLTPASPQATMSYLPNAVGVESIWVPRSLPWDYFAGPVTITTTGVAVGTPVASEVGTDRVTLSVSVSGGEPPYTVQFERLTGTASGFEDVGAAQTVALAAAAASLTVTGLAAGTAHGFRCRVHDTAHPTVWSVSGAVTVTTLAAPGGGGDDDEPPAVTCYTVSGAGSVAFGQTLTVTVALDGPYTGTITLTPTGGGLTAPCTLTFVDSAGPRTVALTPTVAGPLVLTATSSPALSDPAPLQVVVQALPDGPCTVSRPRPWLPPKRVERRGRSLGRR